FFSLSLILSLFPSLLLRPRRRSPSPVVPGAGRCSPRAPLPLPDPPIHRAPRSRCCWGSSRPRVAAGARLPLPHAACLPPPRLLRRARQGSSPVASSSGGFELRRAGERAAAAARRDLEDDAAVVDRDAGRPPRGGRGSPKQGTIFSSSPLRGSICLAERPAARRGQLLEATRPFSAGLVRRIPSAATTRVARLVDAFLPKDQR
ncbi:unnamed protein product, partial [Urochloa humidicola]